MEYRFQLLLLIAIFVCGCGGDANMGSVSGKVTLDGQPVSNAMVMFSPKTGGSPSMGRTDDSGNYSLQYNRDVSGAVIGEHLVKVTTYQAAKPDAETPTQQVPEKIPLKYNFQSELMKEVTSGSNTIDLELKSDGPIVQPDVLNKMNKDG